jgi:hypothetical protein
MIGKSVSTDGRVADASIQTGECSSPNGRVKKTKKREGRKRGGREREGEKSDVMKGLITNGRILGPGVVTEERLRTNGRVPVTRRLSPIKGGVAKKRIKADSSVVLASRKIEEGVGALGRVVVGIASVRRW